MEDTERLILSRQSSGGTSSCSGLDPMEDTESRRVAAREYLPAIVAVGSIRWRILKVALPLRTCSSISGCSGLDPMEDTERQGAAALAGQGGCCSGLDPMEDTERNCQPRSP